MIRFPVKKLPPQEQAITHQCPSAGSGVMLCCNKTPLEVPVYHRITEDPNLVTCLDGQASKR